MCTSQHDGIFGAFLARVVLYFVFFVLWLGLVGLNCEDIEDKRLICRYSYTSIRACYALLCSVEDVKKMEAQPCAFGRNSTMSTLLC